MATNSTNATQVYLNFGDHVDYLPLLAIFIVIGISVSIFNILSISIILCSKKLNRAYNYPIISVLLGATLQSLFTIPAYALKRMDNQIYHTPESWICNLYRFPYFMCGDVLRISLMLVSFDRLIAVKSPYTYKKVITKNVYAIVISFIWMGVFLVDSIPFFPLDKTPDAEGCNFIPTHVWNIGVIIGFNIIPFIVVVVNYMMLWRLAAHITVKDNTLHRGTLLRLGDRKKNNSSIERQRFVYGPCSEYCQRNFLDVEVSIKHFDADRKNTYNRKKSYMLAVVECQGESCDVVEMDENSSDRKGSTQTFIGRQELCRKGLATTYISSTFSQCCTRTQCYTKSQDSKRSHDSKRSQDSTQTQYSKRSQDSRKSETSSRKTSSASLGSLGGSLDVSDKLRLLWEMKATKTSATLLFVYIMCWAPLGTYYFIENICASWISGIQHHHTYMDKFVLKVMSFFSSILLPLVYCWKTKLFRRVARRFVRQHSERIRRFRS